MRYIQAVDKFIKTNRNIKEMPDFPENMNALFKAFDLNEAELFSGIDDFSEEYLNLRNAAYRKIKENEITVIYECPCVNTKRKVRHHFNYNYPNFVLLLCDSCHRKEHYRLRSLAVTTANSDIRSAINASAEDR